MPLNTTVVPATDATERAALAQRLRQLKRVFPINSLKRETMGAQDVVDYYEHCHDAYRKYHSAEGAVHMALNDGDRFDADGFYGQLRRIERQWQSPPKDVLELAFGQGFNLAYLAQRHPDVRFQGIDLTPAHLRIAQVRMQAQALSNVQLQLGDFHHLPFADASFDALFCIEAFCYATDLPRALSEAARVLRPGGSFTLFDGYLTRPALAMDANGALAVELVARGMAMDSLQVQGELISAAQQAGFEASELHPLDDAVMPSLRKLERTTSAVIRWPWLGRFALARRHAMRGRNVLAGCLMRGTVALGLIGYRHIVLKKVA